MIALLTAGAIGLAAVTTPSAAQHDPVPAVIDGSAGWDAVDRALDAGRMVQVEAMLADWRAAHAGASDPAYIVRAARLALAHGAVDAAIAALEPLASDDCRVDEALGQAYLLANRDADALARLTRATQRCAVRWQGWNLIGIAFDRAGRFADSRRAYETAFQLTDRPAAVLNNAAYSLILQQRPDVASAMFTLAARAEPFNERYRNNADMARALAGLPPMTVRGELPARRDQRLANEAWVRAATGDRRTAVALLTRSILASDTTQPGREAMLRAVSGAR